MAILGARKEAILEVKDEAGAVVEEVRALFTNRALADAETKLGKSISMTINGFLTGKSGVREIALLLQAGMEAHRRDVKSSGSPVSFDEACDVLDMVGLTPAANVIGAAITAVVNYGKENSTKTAEDATDEKNA